ncbi:MAG: MTH1187 family thiamine-binding protein [Thermoplasmatota archaeon]
MYVGFLIVSPIDKGTSLSRYVRKGIEAIRETGIEHQVTAMGTIVQSGSIQEIFDAAEAAAEAIHREGSDRISLSLKIDIRHDKDITMASKLGAVGE